MTRHLVFPCLLLTVLTGAACAAEQDPESADNASGLGFAHFHAALPDAYCSWLEQCGKLDGTRGECVADVTKGVAHDLSCTRAKSLYDANATWIDRCLDAKSRVCGRTDDFNDFCPEGAEFEDICKDLPSPSSSAAASGSGGASGGPAGAGGSSSPECTSDTGCASRRKCQSGRCVSVQCTSDSHCGSCQRCISNSCSSCGMGPSGCFC
jgi:hypothetical protein